MTLAEIDAEGFVRDLRTRGLLPNEPEDEAMSLITLVKDGKECNVEKRQVEAMKAAGWREPGEHETEGATKDGGEQHAGRALDQERRKRKDERGSLDEKRVEQPASSGGDEPDGG